MLGIDLVAGLALVAWAVRMQPGRAERDATAVREAARSDLARQTQLVRLATALFALLRR